MGFTKNKKMTAELLKETVEKVYSFMIGGKYKISVEKVSNAKNEPRYNFYVKDMKASRMKKFFLRDSLALCTGLELPENWNPKTNMLYEGNDLTITGIQSEVFSEITMNYRI